MTSRPNVMEANLDCCLDRGEQYVNEAIERGLWHDKLQEIDKALNEVNQQLSAEKQTKKSAENKMKKRIEAAESTIVNDKSIIHLQALRRAMTPELLQEVLVRYDAYAVEAHRKEAASKICSSYCKVFAILLKSNKAKAIASFVDQNIDDSNLPLQIKQRDGKYGVSLKNNLFGFIQELGKSDWQTFFHWQWVFLTPFFARPRGKVLHYSLESDDILPITVREDYQSEEKYVREEESGSETEKPVQIKRISAAYGGHSTVSKIKFDALSCDFGDFRVRMLNVMSITLAHNHSSNIAMVGTH